MIFLDTEFTDLKYPALLSFAMVSLDGSEIYTELDLMEDPVGQKRLKASSNFTRNVVIPQFGRIAGSMCSAKELGGRAGEWLIAQSATAAAEITVAFDHPCDLALLQHAMSEAGVWDQVWRTLRARNVGRITGSAEGQRAAEASWLKSSQFRGLDRHHALADALALKAAWLASADQ